jgi:hypothetical protein
LSSDLDTQNNTLSADVDFLGTSYVIGIPTTITDVPERKEILPIEYFLKQNYPNPFNPSTKISFEIPEYCVVHLTVYNILGKEIAVITKGEFSPGVYSYNWNGSSLASGIYLLRMYAQSSGGRSYSSVKKLVLLK